MADRDEEQDPLVREFEALADYHHNLYLAAHNAALDLTVVINEGVVEDLERQKTGHPETRPLAQEQGGVALDEENDLGNDLLDLDGTMAITGEIYKGMLQHLLVAGRLTVDALAAKAARTWIRKAKKTISSKTKGDGSQKSAQ